MESRVLQPMSQILRYHHGVFIDIARAPMEFLGIQKSCDMSERPVTTYLV